MAARERCVLCDARALSTFVTRSGVPIHQNRVFRSEREALSAPRGDLDFVICRSCGFVFNRAFDSELVLYGPEYDNSQTYSESFLSYVTGLVEHLVHDRNVTEADIVEVGCGKGRFIRALIEYPGVKNRGVGFDPSYEGPLTEADGRLRFERRFYGPDCASIPADVVVCRHVIEHVPEPKRFLASVHEALADRNGARLFFETPCVEWILDQQVIWDLFYEHCSLFTTSSIRALFEAAGFRVSDVRHVFRGQYLWLEGQVGAPRLQERDVRPLVARAEAFGTAEKELTAEWSARLTSYARRGKVAVWGAGAKGVTFVNLIDPQRVLIDCVVDVNPNKQGGHVPVSGHPIVSPGDLPGRKVEFAMVMNPNYVGENRALLADLGISVELFQ